MKVAEPHFKIPSQIHFAQASFPQSMRRLEERWKHTYIPFSIAQSLPTSGQPSIRWEATWALPVMPSAVNGNWSTQELPVDHTAENLSDALREMMIEWDISEKVAGSTTDNAKNIANAVKTFDMFNMPCIGHTNQLKSFKLDLVSKMLGRLQMSAGHFHRSSKASAKLHEKQQLLGLPVHNLLNDCIMRLTQC